MRALVTGACGFVGGHLIQHLLDSGDEVIGAIGRDPVINQACRYERLDITDYRACVDLISALEPDVVYHLAGIAFVPECEESFDKALRVNVGGTFNVLRASYLLNKKLSFVLAGSAEVYGRVSDVDLPLRESLPLRPVNNYALSKVMAENVISRFAHAEFIRAVILRPLNHIGVGQDHRFVTSNFAYQLAQMALGLRDPVLHVGNLEARRDFSDVKDIVQAYRLAAQHGKGIYNLSSGKDISIDEILRMLIEISGVDVTIKQDPARMRPADQPRLVGSSELAKQELGWQPKIGLKQSLVEIYQYWLNKVKLDSQ